MKKVISIALFGDASRKDGSGQNYHRYLPTFVTAHANLFPVSEGWELRVHVDEVTLSGTYGKMLKHLEDEALLNVVPMGEAVLTHAMLWRMAPVFEPGVDYVFCRDIDALPMPRDRAVCDVFIASGCAVHTVHDSSSHAGIMGGLCGFKADAFRRAVGMDTLNELYAFGQKTREEWAQHGTDQHVLNKLIDRADGPTLLEHRYNGWHAGPGKHEARKAGSYRCKTLSTPTPNVGKSKLAAGRTTSVDNWITPAEYADYLANHLGSAGYDIEKAEKFWQREGGNVAIAETVKRACEQA